MKALVLLKYNYKQDVMRFAQLAVRVWGCSMDFANLERTALEGIDRFRAFLKSIGMPLTLAEIGGKEEDIPDMAKNVVYGNGGSGNIGGFVSLSEEDVANIYRLVL